MSAPRLQVILKSRGGATQMNRAVITEGIREKKKGEEKVTDKNRIAELEQQIKAMKEGRESLSVVEQTRKRLFGYTRNRMASDGGSIVG